MHVPRSARSPLQLATFMKQLSVMQQVGQTGSKKYTFFVAVGDLYEASNYRWCNSSVMHVPRSTRSLLQLATFMKQLSLMQQVGQTCSKKYTFFVAVGDLYEAAVGDERVMQDRFQEVHVLCYSLRPL